MKKTVLSLALSVVLLFQTPLALSQAKPSMDRKITEHAYATAGLDILFNKIEKTKSVADFKKLVTAQLSKTGKAVANKHLKELKAVPKIERLHRGFSFTMNGKKYDFGFEEITTGKMVVNDVPFTVQLNQPLEKQIEDLARRLGYKQTSFLWNLMVPQAEAVVWWIPLLVGFGLGLSPVAYATFVKPRIDDRYCRNADPNHYPDFVLCEAYFNFRAKQDKGITKAKPEDPPTEPEVETVANHVCPKKLEVGGKQEMTDFVHTESTKDGMSTILRQTISYKPDGTPLRVVVDLTRPRRRTVTYDLNDEALIRRVSDNQDLFLSRDAKDSDRMKGVKLELFEPFDNNLKMLDSLFRSKCTVSKQTIEQAAEIASTARTAPPPDGPPLLGPGRK